jgi:pantetheine-phosphate adenylyltransferase
MDAPLLHLAALGDDAADVEQRLRGDAAAEQAGAAEAGVAINDGKGPLFSLEERTEMVLEEAQKLANGVEIEARPFDNLLMHFAEQCGAQVIIRGLRAVSDFEYEFQMVAMNQQMNDEIETVFLMADPHHQAVSSRLVKEIARLGGNADLFVPAAVHARLLAKFGVKKGK